MQSRASRSLCYALVLALVSTVLPTPLAKPASAQLMPTYSVGVVDFINESGVQGDLLARLATDAVVVEMSKTNRYDVSITRTMLKLEMENLGLRPPLTTIGLVRLGERLSADAMLEGAIKSVQIAGSGPTRRASVTLVAQMVDQASGEIINGAVQTGSSSARVGYTADDNALITEAINNAAFLAVKTMIDYVIPEATIMMNVGSSQVMINKGARDGIKAGMRMIVLRDREIIGYVDVTSTDPTDSYAKVIKSMRGIQPQDKARAIFEMPTVSNALKSEPLPSQAPGHNRMGGSAGSKIGKFLVGLLIVAGIASIFIGGSGSPDAPRASAAGPLVIRWDPKLYNHGGNVSELQVIRDQDAGNLGAVPVRAIRDMAQWNSGFTDLSGLYGSGPFTVTYYQMPLGSTTPTSAQQPYTDEGYGITHQYQLRALLRTQTGVDATTQVPTYKYEFTKFGNLIAATAVDSVKRSSIVTPLDGESLYVSLLRTGQANLTWQPTVGGDQYRVTVQPVQPGAGPTWMSSIIYYGSGTEMSLSDIDRLALAAALSSPLYIDKEMKWHVDARHGGDTSPDWVTGDTVVFRIGGTPGGPP
jgi:hypothetical protein